MAGMTSPHEQAASSEIPKDFPYYREDERHPLLGTGCINSNVSSDGPGSVRVSNVMSRRRALKNFFVLSLSIFFVFLGFQSLSNLQSTMNSQKGVGTDSLAVMYVFAMISAILLPKITITRCGVKNTIIIMALLGFPYIAANFYPVWQVLIPAAVFIGIATGPLSAADFVYVNSLTHAYKAHVAENLEVVSARFYGIHAFFTENTQIWGNLISYFVLKQSYPSSDVVHMNESLPKCGVHFDASANYSFSNVTSANMQPPTDSERYLLVGIYCALCLLAGLILFLFLDPLPGDAGTRASPGESSGQSIVAAIHQMGDANQILLLPLTVFIGLQLAFYTADFTQAYIACSWGIHHVGFVTICFGVCASTTAVLLGPAVKLCGQPCVIIISFICITANCAFLFFWTPVATDVTTFFVVAGVWGATDAVWWSQISALYGVMFPHKSEAAFSNFFFWTSLGFSLSYSCTNYLSIPVKLTVLLCFLVIGLIGYFACQIRLRCSYRLKYEAVVKT